MLSSGGDHTALRDAASTVGFQHDLQQSHHVCIIHSLGHLGQQPVVPDVVEVAAQVDVYDACLVLNNCLRHPVDRFMSCPPGTISKRARLEVGLEDRLQYQLERALHHVALEARLRHDRELQELKGRGPCPRPSVSPAAGPVTAHRCALSSSLIRTRNASTPCASMAAKVTPSSPGAPSFFRASAYAARRVSSLQTWTYKPQNRQDASAFALT